MPKPAKGQPVDELWSAVAELWDVIEAIKNMTVKFNVDNPTTGKLFIGKGESTLVLQ
jgi:hypothetical protein